MRCEQCAAKDATTLWGLRTGRSAVVAVAGALACGLIIPLVLRLTMGSRATVIFGLPWLLNTMVVFAGTQYITQRAVLHYPHAANRGGLVLAVVTKIILVLAAGILLVFLPLERLLGG